MFGVAIVFPRLGHTIKANYVIPKIIDPEIIQEVIDISKSCWISIL